MVLDVVTYLCVMGILGGFVLLHEDNTFEWAEIVFAFYIRVSDPFLFHVGVECRGRRRMHAVLRWCM